MGGFALEVLAAWQDFDLAQTYEYAGFFDDNPDFEKEGHWRGNLQALQNLPPGEALLITFSSPSGKKNGFQFWKDSSFVFPNAIHTQARIGKDVLLGSGNIISAGCLLTTRIVLGDFNMLNHYVTIGHHSQIGSGNAFMPKAHLSGHVQMGDFNLLAVGCSILQGKKMGSLNQLGPHACLMHNVGDNATYLGVPALRQ